jgi:hypothetical protein
MEIEVEVEVDVDGDSGIWRQIGNRVRWRQR